MGQNVTAEAPRFFGADHPHSFTVSKGDVEDDSSPTLGEAIRSLEDLTPEELKQVVEFVANLKLKHSSNVQDEYDPYDNGVNP